MAFRFTLGKRFDEFSCAHRLPDLPAGHKCARLHGHNFTVEIVLGADVLVPPGFVVDFGDLKPFGEYLDATMDHTYLNEVLAEPPTCENLARHLAEWFLSNMPERAAAALTRVVVSEKQTTWAAYEVPGRST